MAPTAPSAAPVNVTVHVDTASAEDFGSEPPASAPVAHDPNRPLRRKK